MRTATDILQLDVQQHQQQHQMRQNCMGNQIQLARVRQQHNHNVILGTSVLANNEQRQEHHDDSLAEQRAGHRQRQEHHRDVQGQRDEHHRDVQGQRDEQHRDVQGQRDEQHRDVQGQRGEHHRDIQGQRDEHHAAEKEQRDLEMERATTSSRIKFFSDASFLILTLCCLFALALVSHHHMTNFTEDPCPYFEQWSPSGMMSVSKWWNLLGLGTAEQANCALAMIWVALSLLLYVVVTIFLPTQVNSLLFLGVFFMSIYKLLQDTANQIIGMVLTGLIVPTGLAYLLSTISLYDALDDCDSSVELKRARKKFEKIMKRIWAFQFVCMVFAGVVFVALGSSKSN